MVTVGESLPVRGMQKTGRKGGAPIDPTARSGRTHRVPPKFWDPEDFAPRKVSENPGDTEYASEDL